MGKEYYLGLDMGTGSVGWAVTDSEYHLLRAKGKDLWGVRLFDEAQSSADRRSHRVARRRRAREKARIGYLQMVFADAINQVDSGFYQRLNESKYHEEDKTTGQKYALFSSDTFTDKDYYDAFPTIFHLRKELVDSDEPHDVRLVYLALLNMFKHRGHFLNESLTTEELPVFEELWGNVSRAVEGWPKTQNLFEIKQLLTDKGMSKSRRKDGLLSLLKIDKKDIKAEMLGAICGLKVDVRKIVPEGMLAEDAGIDKVSFLSSDYEEKETVLLDQLDEETFEVIGNLKQIHDWCLLSNILQDCTTLSHARVASYEKHQKDLEVLKRILKKYDRHNYHLLFRTMQDNTYSAYVGFVDYKGKKERRSAKCDPEKFFSMLKKIVAAMPQDQDTKYVLAEIETETFLPKQLVATNGVIPNQVHVAEMKRILENAEKYLPFLKEKDDSGLTCSERILALFSFHIPYYIGPLKNSSDNHAWVVRKEAGRVFPWNLEQKVDVEKTREEFIKELIKEDTYLTGTKVLPKNSLLYEKYMVLNELNNLKINGELSTDLKQELFMKLFRKGKRVTAKQLKEYLKNNGYISPDEDPVITGIDQDFTNTCANYAKFCAIFETNVMTYEQEKAAEGIIRLSTIYGDAKKVLKQQIKEQFGSILSEKQLKRVLGLKFRDWGRLSRDLLELEGVDKSTGEVKTLIGRMWDENCNLMQLLSSDYTYSERIEERTNQSKKTLEEVMYEDLTELYISAPVRRMVWQTIKIVREIHQVMGCGPERIFIEMARETNAPKRRTESRQKKFLDLYKKCGAEGKEWVKEIQGMTEGQFRSKKLYLYYTQMGKCMYTGERIDPDQLFNDNMYDIDHIHPRHFVKDDSIENNLVLVKKEKNARKSDTYPVDAEIRNRMYSFWKSLQDRDLITMEKFRRLIRSTSFSQEERAGFINRQLVETRQGTKTVAQIMETTFPDAEVIYSKAGNVSDFRHHFDLIKCRDVNDFHHANDAYLNIVVGNAYFVKFTKDPRRFIAEYDKDRKNNEYHMDKLFDYTIKRGNQVAWVKENDQSLKIVKAVMSRNTPLVTMRSYEAHGGLADQTIYSAAEAGKAKGVGYLPIKSSDEVMRDTTKYGGFKKYAGTYFFLVEHEEKGKRVRTIENLPLYLAGSCNNKEWLESYCVKMLGLSEPEVRYEKIRMYSKIRVNGFELYLTARQKDRLKVMNAVELKLKAEEMTYIKRLIDRLDRGYDIEEDPFISADNNTLIYKELMRKHRDMIYKKRPNAIGECLLNGADAFEQLELSRQAFVIRQILQITRLNNNGADLSDIGESKSTGIATISKKISGMDEFTLIESSVTGLFQRKIDLLTI